MQNGMRVVLKSGEHYPTESVRMKSICFLYLTVIARKSKNRFFNPFHTRFLFRNPFDRRTKAQATPS